MESVYQHFNLLIFDIKEHPPHTFLVKLCHGVNNTWWGNQELEFQ